MINGKEMTAQEIFEQVDRGEEVVLPIEQEEKGDAVLDIFNENYTEEDCMTLRKHKSFTDGTIKLYLE
jgi:hypothetical protein